MIIAGTAVSIALNGESLFGKAEEATSEWNKASKDEEKSILEHIDYISEAMGDIPDINPDYMDLPVPKEIDEIPDEYIPIYSSIQLQKVATNAEEVINGKTYTMTPNAKYILMVNLTDVTMQPIKGFTGEFDGNGHTIKGLNIDTTSSSQDYKNPVDSSTNRYHPAGLFECIIGGIVKNLAIINANIQAKESVGAIAGQGDNVTIENCYVKDSSLTCMVSWRASAAIIGYIGNNGGSIRNCKTVSTNVICESTSNNITYSHVATSGICSTAIGPITITNCEVINTNETPLIYGAGILYNGQNNITVGNCKVQNIVLEYYAGGGIVAAAGQNSIINDEFTTTINSCSAKNITIDRNARAGIISVAKFKNLVVKDCRVQGLIVTSNADYNIGGIVGIGEARDITIEGCQVKNVENNKSCALAGIINTTNNSSASIGIKNCRVEKIESKVPTSVIGGVAYTLGGNYTIENCNIKNISTPQITFCYGGIVAMNNGNCSNINVKIKNCNVNDVNLGTINSPYSGGIIGAAGSTAQMTEISGCKVNNLNISKGQCNGGIAGIFDRGTISNCNVSNVTFDYPTYRAGGICGHADMDTAITDCSVSNLVIRTDSTTASNSMYGGITGFGTSASGCNVENSNIETSYPTLAVGGIIGHGMKNSSKETLVQNCKFTGGSIKGTAKYIGGIAGAAVENISNCTIYGTEIEGSNITAFGGVQGYGGALVGASGNSGSTRPTVIDNCHVTNCGEINVSCFDSNNVNYYEGRKTEDGSGTSNDIISDNCTHNGTYINGVISEYPEGWNNYNQLAEIYEDGSYKVPIPKGFVVSGATGENSVSTGLVIYESGDVQITDSNVATAKATYNQYVWIPISDINSMFMCKQNNISTGTGNTKICNIVRQSDGNLYCTVHSRSGKTNICGRLYMQSASIQKISENEYLYATSMDFTQNTQKYSTSTSETNAGYLEPAVVSYDGSSENYHGLGTSNAFLNQIQGDFYEMAKSVATYGGFYVGRYELGVSNDSNIAVRKNQRIFGSAIYDSHDSNIDYRQSWYRLYNACRKIDNTNRIEKTMIWGCQYDQIIKFIGSAAETGHSFSRRTYSLPRYSGSNGDVDKMKNIYDLEASVYEWTMTAHDYGRTYRGDCNSSSTSSWGASYFPASFKSQYCDQPTGMGWSATTRPVLYIEI